MQDRERQPSIETVLCKTYSNCNDACGALSKDQSLWNNNPYIDALPNFQNEQGQCGLSNTFITNMATTTKSTKYKLQA